MRRLETWTSVIEHPAYGEIELLWTWQEHGDMYATPVLIGCQTSFWVPVDEVASLLDWARQQRARLLTD